MVVTIKVTAIELPTTIVDTTGCANAFPATIFGHVFTVPGSITDTIPSLTGGCDTVRTINVTAVELPTTIVDTTVCANAFPATIFGHVFTVPGSITDTIPSLTGGCDTVITMNVTSVELPTTLFHSTILLHSFPATIFGHVFTVPGSITDTIPSLTGGCDTVRTINVTAVELPTTIVD